MVHINENESLFVINAVITALVKLISAMCGWQGNTFIQGIGTIMYVQHRVHATNQMYDMK